MRGEGEASRLLSEAAEGRGMHWRKNRSETAGLLLWSLTCMRRGRLYSAECTVPDSAGLGWRCEGRSQHEGGDAVMRLAEITAPRPEGRAATERQKGVPEPGGLTRAREWQNTSENEGLLVLEGVLSRGPENDCLNFVNWYCQV